MNKVTCPSCEGDRLKKEARYFRIGEASIADLARMSISRLSNWFENIEEEMDENQKVIAREILKELRTRSSFLLDRAPAADSFSEWRQIGSLKSPQSCFIDYCSVMRSCSGQ